jgi:hypothetical protein
MNINDLNYIENIEASEVQGAGLPLFSIGESEALSDAFGTALSITSTKTLTSTIALPGEKKSISGALSSSGAGV